MLFFILPIAFRKLVKGVETEEKAALIEKKASAKSAGSHLVYLGITLIK